MFGCIWKNHKHLCLGWVLRCPYPNLCSTAGSSPSELSTTGKHCLQPSWHAFGIIYSSQTLLQESLQREGSQGSTQPFLAGNCLQPLSVSVSMSTFPWSLITAVQVSDKSVIYSLGHSSQPYIVNLFIIIPLYSDRIYQRFHHGSLHWWNAFKLPETFLF